MVPHKIIAATTTEALKLVREQVGGDALVLSTRDTPDGVEIVAISPEALSTLSQRKDAEGLGQFAAPTFTSSSNSTAANTGFSPEVAPASANASAS